jgi:hypothetical protein
MTDSTTPHRITVEASANRSNKIVDINMYWMPEDLFSNEPLLNRFVNSVPKAQGIFARVEPIADRNIRQIIIEQPKGFVNLNYAENQYRLEGQLSDMANAGVDHGIFRMPGWQEWLDLDTCKIVNDALADHVKRSEGHLSALAMAPPWGTAEAKREVERCVKQLGFRGVQMASHYGSLQLDDEAFRSYFSFLNGLGVPVVVHHTSLPVEYGSILDYANLRRQYGRCVAQMTAIGRELFSGMFNDLPNLKLIHSMMGGGFFAYADTLVPPRSSTEHKDAVDRFEEQTDRLRHQLKENLFFETSGAPQWGKAQFECAVKVLGAKNILYGSSYPVLMKWYFGGIEFVKSLDISEEDKSLILGGNAMRLFNLTA